ARYTRARLRQVSFRRAAEPASGADPATRRPPDPGTLRDGHGTNLVTVTGQILMAVHKRAEPMLKMPARRRWSWRGRNENPSTSPNLGFGPSRCVCMGN